jgi:MFS family permease
MGFSMSMAMSLANATVQSSAPDALRGRVMSVYMTVFMGTVPIGSIVAGVASEHLGTPASIGIGGAIALTVATVIAGISRRSSRAVDRQAPRPVPVELARGVSGELRIAGGAARRSFASRRED